MTTPHYRGRFAPSPTGPLHYGSLFAAVFSYLEARTNKGAWLLRIEDIDPPRENPKAKRQIPLTLQAHGLIWDEEPLFQSNRSEQYDELLAHLARIKCTFVCPCSRKQLCDLNQHLPGCGKSGNISNVSIGAIKFHTNGQRYTWHDGIQGKLTYGLEDDFVIKRKDHLYAYQLACVVDDITQDITHVVRGADLLESTPMQLALFDAIGHPPPQYSHFPVILDKNGQKLSKQNLSKPVDDTNPIDNLLRVFEQLGIVLPKRPKTPALALEMAEMHWPQISIPAVTTLTITKQLSLTSNLL